MSLFGGGGDFKAGRDWGGNNVNIVILSEDMGGGNIFYLRGIAPAFCLAALLIVLPN